MITLDDVNRIKAILIAHGEWLREEFERYRVNEDGVFVWTTFSCSGKAIAALMADGFNVYVWPSILHQEYLEIHISK